MFILARVLKLRLCFQPSGRCITDDGSYTPSMDKPEQALDFVQDVLSACGYNPGTDVQIALNCAASEFYDQVRKQSRISSFLSLLCSLDETSDS